MESANINRELDEKRTCLGAGTAVVPACHILSESAMQGVDPTGSSEDSSVMNKVCAVIFSSLQSLPPLTTNGPDKSPHRCHVPS